MRIIAGQAKGMTIKSPPGRATRPMDGRARGALFNILTSRLPGARVLDLYAGSGSLGLEALSRGAQSCVFVERSRAAARLITENLERSRLTGGEVLAVPCALALTGLEARAATFSIAFFDPPFPKAREAGSRSALTRELAGVAELLEPGAVVIWRLERRNYHEEELPGGLEQIDRREYGRSLLVFASPSAAPEAEEQA